MPRGDAEPGDRADRGQGLAAEPERANAQEILVVEFGRGVAVDGKREIAMRHAAAVVGDADPPPTAAIGKDVDPAGAGVDGVFDEFLDHARGTFDHLAGGDAVDDLFGELADGHEAGLIIDSRLEGHSRRLGRQMHGKTPNQCPAGDEGGLSP
jgi:hypothetical protein